MQKAEGSKPTAEPPGCVERTAYCLLPTAYCFPLSFRIVNLNLF